MAKDAQIDERAGSGDSLIKRAHLPIFGRMLIMRRVLQIDINRQDGFTVKINPLEQLWIFGGEQDHGHMIKMAGCAGSFNCQTSGGYFDFLVARIHSQVRNHRGQMPVNHFRCLEVIVVATGFQACRTKLRRDEFRSYFKSRRGRKSALQRVRSQKRQVSAQFGGAHRVQRPLDVRRKRWRRGSQRDGCKQRRPKPTFQESSITSRLPKVSVLHRKYGNVAVIS